MGEKSEVGEGKWKSLDQHARMELIARYRTLLASKRRSPRYIQNTSGELHRLLHAARWELDEDAILAALADFRDKGMSIRTANKYAVGIKSFANWLTRREHFPLNPLRFLPLLNAKLDRRHERASFSDDEIYRLLTTTRASKFLFKGLVGRDRAQLYHAALATGLREGTLAVLRVRQFVFGPTPYVRVDANQLKDAEDLIVPLHPVSAGAIRSYLSGMAPDALAFRTPPNRWDYVRMLRKDLIAAGIPYCRKEVLDNGRTRRRDVLDFHSFRASTATRMLAHGVPVGTVQTILGHSTPELTMRYNHAATADTWAAVSRLPPIPGVQAGI